MKIRVLDLATNRFLTGDFSFGVETGEIRGKYGEKFEDLKPIFSSGIKDKNNKEIYEGDILSFGDDYPNEKVVFENGCFFRKERNYFIPLYEDEGNLFMEIIGNIYQNSELLIK